MARKQAGWAVPAALGGRRRGQIDTTEMVAGASVTSRAVMDTGRGRSALRGAF